MTDPTLRHLRATERQLERALDQTRQAIRSHLATRTDPRGRLVDVDDLQPGDILVDASALAAHAGRRPKSVAVRDVEGDPAHPDTRWVRRTDGRQHLAHRGDAVRIRLEWGEEVAF